MKIKVVKEVVAVPQFNEEAATGSLGDKNVKEINMSFEDEYEDEQEHIIRCPYCGSAFHYIPGLINDGEPLLYTLHVQIEQVVHGGRKAIRQFQKASKRIEKKCRKIRRLLSDGDCNG